jgi:lactoylglutathione lyase
MIIEHIAIWTDDIERLKTFYLKFFGGQPSSKYRNEVKQFESYFISFESGARLEIMTRVDINSRAPSNQSPYLGLAHIAFGVKDMQKVDRQAEILTAGGYPILSGPRRTGDGYYEFEIADPDGNLIEVTSAFEGK